MRHKYYWEVMFACLLHDIGKALDRAYTKNSGTYLGVDMQGSHPVKGARWVKAHKEMFEHAGLDVDALAEMVLRHHDGQYGGEYKTSDAPKELLGYCKIVGEADNFSSANTRFGAEKTGASDYHLLKDLIGNVAGVGLYRTATGNKVDHQVDANTGKKEQLEASMQVNNFDAEVSKLDETDASALYTKLAELMYKYLYYVNPATNSKDADAGLWDHSSTTAGIGNCMYVNMTDTQGDDFKYKKSDVYMLKLDMQDNGFENLTGDTEQVLYGRIKLKEKEMENIIDRVMKCIDGVSINILSRNKSVCYMMIPASRLKVVQESLVAINESLLLKYRSELSMNWKVAKYDFDKDFHSNMKMGIAYNGQYEVYKNKFALVQKRDVKAVRCKYCGAVGNDTCKVCEKALEFGDSKGKFKNVMALKVKISNFDDVLNNGMKNDCTISRVSGYFKRVKDELNEIVKSLNGYVLKQTEDSVYMLINFDGKAYSRIKAAVDSFNLNTLDVFKCRVATKVYKDLYKSNIIDALDSVYERLESKDNTINIYTLYTNWSTVPSFTSQYSKYVEAKKDKYIGKSSLYKAEKYYTMMINDKYECVALMLYESKKAADLESKAKFFDTLRTEIVTYADKKLMLKLKRLALEIALRED